MTRRLRIEASMSGATAILRFQPGTVFFDEIDELPVMVADFIRGRGKAIVLNLNGLRFAGNRPLGALVHAYATCRKAHVPLVLCGVGDRTREILRITKLDRVFEACESEAAAVRAVQASSSGAPIRADVENGVRDDPPLDP